MPKLPRLLYKLRTSRGASSKVGVGPQCLRSGSMDLVVFCSASSDQSQLLWRYVVMWQGCTRNKIARWIAVGQLLLSKRHSLGSFSIWPVMAWRVVVAESKRISRRRLTILGEEWTSKALICGAAGKVWWIRRCGG